ncbi:MAG: histidinol-phosphate transaminase [Calditrichaceae bacterium]
MPLVPEHINSLQPYQAGKSTEELRREYGLEKIIKLASNENPLGVSPKALKAMKNNLKSLNRYPSPDSYELRQILARIYEVKMNNVFTGHGSESIISTIIRTFLHDEDTVLSSEGTFITFRIQAQSRGIKVIEVPLNNYRYNLAAIAERITDTTKIIYLANPNNPTGNIFSDDEFKHFMGKVPKQTLVLLDEAYFEFAIHDPEYPDSMKYRFDNVISLRTFSKAYGLAGVRIGYGFAHENLINNLMKIKLPFEPSGTAQAAAVAALTDTAFLDKTIKLARDGRKFFYNFFDNTGIRYLESHANFVTIILDSEEQVNYIFQSLLKRGVIVRPLKSFGLPNCIRITTGLPEENRIFSENL